jgi:ribose transport system substrate-binding protein
VECGDPDCANLAGYLKQSTGALGWTLTTFPASTRDLGAAVQQAIDSGADYVAVTGTPLASFPQQLAQMKAKGIPLFECYATDVPGGAANDLYADCDDASAAALYGTAMADYVVGDSGGSANVVTISIPAYAILTAQSEAFASSVASLCPSCSVGTMNVTVSDVATGGVPNQIVSYLETHPQVTYVFVTLSRIEAGLAPALKAAGLAGRVKVVGTAGQQPQFQEIVDGTSSVWSAVPEQLSMWTLADQMARLSVHAWSPTEERQAALTPFYLVTSADQARPLVGLPLGWSGPAGYQDAFKRLWGV